MLFFGTSRNRAFGMYINQAAHLLTLLLAGLVGRLYWQKGWVRTLWDGLYMAVIVTVVVSALLLFVFGYKGTSLNQIVAQLRNNFEGPLPFLVIYLLSSIGSQLADRQPTQNNSLESK